MHIDKVTLLRDSLFLPLISISHIVSIRNALNMIRSSRNSRQRKDALETLYEIQTQSHSLFTFAGNKLYGGHTSYDAAGNGLYVNCHEFVVFHYLSRQDPITLALETKELLQQNLLQQILEINM